MPYLLTSVKYFAELYIDSALLSLVGSDFPVVYEETFNGLGSSEYKRGIRGSEHIFIFQRVP